MGLIFEFPVSYSYLTPEFDLILFAIFTLLAIFVKKHFITFDCGSESQIQFNLKGISKAALDEFLEDFEEKYTAPSAGMNNVLLALNWQADIPIKRKL